jgi:peptide/nickel transport system ATP-binding protein
MSSRDSDAASSHTDGASSRTDGASSHTDGASSHTAAGDTSGISAERTARREEPMLEVENLRTTFYTDKETIRAVDGVSFDLYPGRTTGIVGESGSGKSVTARSIMGLIDDPGRIDAGSIRFRHEPTVERFASKYDGRTAEPGETPAGDDFVVVEERSGGDVTDGYIEMTDAPKKALQKLRGGGISMVFQDPLSSLNPVYTVGNQIEEAIKLHRDLEGAEVTELAIDLLESVGIPDAPRRLKEYPHEFSGGMRQRAVIAMALACNPEVLICDEPTTALDVTIQAQILQLLEELTEERDLAIMFITHDMGVIAELSDRVNVMYAGEIVESAPAVNLFEDPAHPYTEGLLGSIPGRQVGADRLQTIEGDVPTPTEEPTYCRFAPRCPKAFEDCESVHPTKVAVTADGDADEHGVSCLLYPESDSAAQRVDRHASADDTGGDRL